MEKADVIFLNGKFVSWDDAKIHVLTHALHYGTGVFEGLRCYETVDGAAIFRLKDHIERLYDSAHILKMEVPLSKKDFSEAVKETVRRNNLTSCYIRPIVYRGYGTMGVNPLGCPVEYAVAVWSWKAYLGMEALESGIKVITSSFFKYPSNSIPTSGKITGAYVNSVLAKVEALEAGFAEAIMLSPDGYVCEGTGENIFIVKNGSIKTIPAYAQILVGVTRNSVIEIANDLGYSVEETMLSRGQLYLADEAFFTGTAAEITPITEVDRRLVGDGKVGEVTRQLQNKFFGIVKGEDRKYRKWLEYV